MPFTPTHIVAVLPLKYIFQRLSLLALSVGAVIPDFSMFYPIASYKFSHSVMGIFLFCLPLGLVLYWLIDRMGKQFFIDISPVWLQCRIYGYRKPDFSFNIRKISIVSLSIILGSMTHIVWDGFTHKSGWVVVSYPYLEQSLLLGGFNAPLYKFFQYASTVIGLPLLLVIALFYLQRHVPCSPVPTGRVIIPLRLFFYFGVVAIPICIYLLLWDSARPGLYNFGVTLKATIGSEIVFFIFLSAIHNLFEKSEVR